MAVTETIQMSPADVAELTAEVNTLTMSQVPESLMSAIVTAINDVIGNPNASATITVETAPSLRDQFDAAFTPDPADDSVTTGAGVKVTVTKVGR